MNILELAILKKMVGGGGGSGTDNYNDLSNLPKINDTTLSGNKSSSALGLQSEINSDSKLASDLVDDTNQDNKFVTSTEKNTWNAKQNAIDADHKLSSDLVDDANHTNKFVTSTEKQTWNAKQNAIDADHKLSSSLVSFPTAEAAALASGIDSSKVGQISTNQTNILSVQENTPSMSVSNSKTLTTSKGYCYLTDWTKNLFNMSLNYLKTLNSGRTWNGNTASWRGVNYTINDDGSIRVYGTNNGANTSYIYLTPQMSTDDNHYIIGGDPHTETPNTGLTYRYYKADSSWGVGVTDTGNGTLMTSQYPTCEIAVQVPVGATVDFTIYPMFGEGTTPHAYVPYDGYTITSSNSDGTQTDSVFVGTETPSPVMLKTYEGTTVITSDGDVEVVLSNNTQAKAIVNSDVITHEDRNALVEAVDDGAKNRFNFDAWKTVTSARANLSFSGSSVTLESFIADAFTAYEVNPSATLRFPSEALIPFTIGEHIVLTWDYTANSGQSDDKVFIFAFDSAYQQVNAGNTLAQNKKIQMSIPPGTAYVTFRVGVTTSGNSATYSNIMICTKPQFEISPAYAPYALPNYDLTQLEQQDRNALVPVIDKGAKNALYLDIDKIKSIHTAGTWTGNTYVNNGITTTINDDGTIAIYGTATAVYNLAIFADDSGTTKYAGMELSGCPSGGSDSTYLMYAMSGDYASQGSDYGDGVVISNNPITRVRIQVRKNVDMGTEQSPTIFKPMICTEAEWKVSHQFVPYRKNLDQLEATKAPALSTSTAIDSGSLDDVAQNTFAVYTSNVSNVPTSDDYYVETIVYDANNALQKAYNYSDGTSYVRVKNTATWGNWKQITNA